MINILAFIGVVCITPIILGAIFHDRIACHIFIGSVDGAREWHKKMSEKEYKNNIIIK